MNALCLSSLFLFLFFALMPSQVQAQSHVRPSREVETAAASWHSPPSSTNCYTISSPSETDFHFNTVIIQRALNHHSCVSIVPNPESGRGDYRIQSLFLPSHTLLHLDQGVRLIAVIGETQRALVHILNATNVTLQGLGVLYGSAEDAIDYYDEYDNRFQPRWEDGDPLRPTNLWVTNSDRITVQGISIHNCSYWNFRMDNSSHIFVDSIDIYGDSRFPNNDGFDPESSRNVTLINSRINVADDGICPKAKAGLGPLEHLTVRNCTIRSKSHAIKFGSNTDTDMKHILFDNITIWDSNGGLSIQQRSAGTIQNVTFSNIHVETRYQAGRWWGNGEWLSVTRIPRHPDDRVGTMRDLQFINITAKSENGGLLSGFPNHGLESALFENVYVKIMTWSNYSQHPQPCCAITKPICFNSTFTRIDGHEQCLVPHHDEHTDDSEQHLQHHYKKIPCQGSRDYRPLASSVPPECPRGHDRVASKADGIFVEQVRNLRFANVTIEFETPRKPWFGRCIRFRHNENEDYYPHNNNSHHRVQCIGESEGKFGNEKILESAMTIGLQLFGRRLSWELNISSLSDWLLLGSIAMALTCIATHNTKGRHLFGRSGHVTHEAPTTTEKTRLLPRCFSPKLAQKIDHEDGRRSSFDSLSASETTTTILWQNKCLGRRRRYRISVPLFLASLCLLWLFLRPVLGESPSASNRNTNINGAKVPPPPPPKPGMSPQQDHHHYQQQQEQQQVLQVVETESWNGDRWIGAEQRWATLDGRPCVSPADLEAPPDATFDGDWKIVLSASKDPYGWTYERGENPKRQRIWLRILKPITREQAVVKKQQSRSGAAKLSPKTTMKTPAKILPSKLLPKSKSRISTKAATATKIMDTQKVKAALNNALQNIQDDWNFKGFGFSFYKSFLFKKSVGMAFRIPLTTNWDVWERHPEWPSVSMSLLFFYPFTIAASIGGSVNVEWLQWVIVQGGITLRHVIAMILLTLARGFMLAGSALAFPVTRQLYNMPTSWDLLPSLQHSLTEKPTFSSTLQQRVGVSYSWRLSAARGYETRRNIWHLYLPTLLSLIQHLDRVQQQGQRILRRNPYVDYYVRKRQHKRGDTALVASSSSSSSSTAFQPTSLLEKVRDTDWAEWWLRRKTGSLGVSTGYPIPDKPHFSCSGVLSLSGFYFRRETVSSTAGGVSKEDEVAAAVTASMLKSGKNTSQEEEDETSESEEDTAGLARNVASASSVKKTTANA